MKNVFVIAIDGPAASGKGTLARRLAEHFGFDYLDTGLLYRGVGLSYLDQAKTGNVAALAHNLDIASLENPRLRDQDVAQAASVVAAMPEVRQALLMLQKEFASRAQKGAILDGRDIGTVILPDAPAKLFVTADVPTRARRRYRDLENVTLEQVQADIEQRDARDMLRDSAPLRQADDSLLLETTNMSIEEAFSHALSFVEHKKHVYESTSITQRPSETTGWPE